jgi:PAS domain S-box-containing protein
MRNRMEWPGSVPDPAAVMAAARAWLKDPEHVAERFRLFFEEAPLGMIVTDRRGRIVAANHAAAALLGWEPEVLQTRTLPELVHARDRSREAAALERLLAGVQESHEEETRLVTRDGETVHALLRGSLLRDRDGRVLGGLAQIVDVTARRRIEEALRQSEILFRSAFDAAPVGMAIERFDGRLVQVNPALCALIERDEAGLMRDGLGACLHPGDRDRARQLLDLLQAGAIDRHVMEERYLRGGGRIAWTQRTSSVVCDPDGRPLYALSQIQDITEAKAAREAAVREPTERFRICFDQAPIGMALVGTDGRFLRVNHAFCLITGYAEEEMLTSTFASLTHPDDRERDTDALARFLSGRIETYITEKRYVRKDGRIAWVQLHVSAVNDPGDRLIYFISQAVDITARKRAEQVLWEGEERFRVAFEEAPIGMALVTPGGRVSRLNRACAHLLGRGPATPPHFDLAEAAHPDDREDLLRAVGQASEPRRDRVYGLWRFVRSDGEAVPRHLVLSAVRDAHGAVSYLIAQIQDLPTIP